MNDTIDFGKDESKGSLQQRGFWMDEDGRLMYGVEAYVRPDGSVPRFSAESTLIVMEASLAIKDVDFLVWQLSQSAVRVIERMGCLSFDRRLSQIRETLATNLLTLASEGELALVTS